MTMLIPYAGLSPVPWKNGGGNTTQIAVFPPDAGFDDFDWRISLATIAEDGAFSIFPDVDRTLALVEGNGATLDIDGDSQVLCQDDPVAAFAGESEVIAKLNHGPTTDFNVMTRRERCHHVFGVRRLAGESRFAPAAFWGRVAGYRLQVTGSRTVLALKPVTCNRVVIRCAYPDRRRLARSLWRYGLRRGSTSR